MHYKSGDWLLPPDWNESEGCGKAVKAIPFYMPFLYLQIASNFFLNIYYTQNKKDTWISRHSCEKIRSFIKVEKA